MRCRDKGQDHADSVRTPYSHRQLFCGWAVSAKAHRRANTPSPTSRWAPIWRDQGDGSPPPSSSGRPPWRPPSTYKISRQAPVQLLDEASEMTKGRNGHHSAFRWRQAQGGRPRSRCCDRCQTLHRFRSGEPQARYRDHQALGCIKSSADPLGADFRKDDVISAALRAAAPKPVEKSLPGMPVISSLSRNLSQRGFSQSEMSRLRSNALLI